MHGLLCEHITRYILSITRFFGKVNQIGEFSDVDFSQYFCHFFGDFTDSPKSDFPDGQNRFCTADSARIDIVRQHSTKRGQTVVSLQPARIVSVSARGKDARHVKDQARFFLIRITAAAAAHSATVLTTAMPSAVCGFLLPLLLLLLLLLLPPSSLEGMYSAV